MESRALVTEDHDRHYRSLKPIIGPVVVSKGALGDVFVPLGLDLDVDHDLEGFTVPGPNPDQLIGQAGRDLRVREELKQLLVETLRRLGPVDPSVDVREEKREEIFEMVFEDVFPWAVEIVLGNRHLLGSAAKVSARGEAQLKRKSMGKANFAQKTRRSLF